jgi:hypothetical protein
MFALPLKADMRGAPGNVLRSFDVHQYTRSPHVFHFEWAVTEQNREVLMKLTVLFAVAVVSIVASNNAIAQTKSERCEAYARNAAGSTPTTTGAARGAARGAVVGSISGNAGRGAGVGAVVGGTRRVAQRSRSYQSYYNACMSH